MKLEKLLSMSAGAFGIDLSKDMDNKRLLFKCANIVVSNLAYNYQDFVATQTFDTSDGIVDFRKFKKHFYKVKSTKAGGREVNHDLYTGFLSVPVGQVTIEYAYIPQFKSIASTIMFNENILLYGILAEYASISGLEREYKLFNAKFEELMFRNRMTGKARRVR